MGAKKSNNTQRLFFFALVNATVSKSHRGHRLSAPAVLLICPWLHFLVISSTVHFISDLIHAPAFYKPPGKSSCLKFHLCATL